MKDIYKKSEKIFLDETSDFASDEFGSLGWKVSVLEKNSPDDASTQETFYTIDATLRITDCSRSIYLFFYADKEEDLNGRIEKIDTIITSLQRFKDSIAESKRLFDEKGLKFSP